jgi:hypothetical protein
MKYLLIHRLDEAAKLSPDDDSDVPGSAAALAQDAWDTEMEDRGVKLCGVRLQPVSDATTVRVRGGEVLVSDGPFAETKEQIAGFNILECTNLEQAIQIASQHPTAKIGTFELRPLWQP